MCLSRARRARTRRTVAEGGDAVPKPIIIRSLAFVLALFCVASTADARTMIRRQSPYDNVSFHGNYGGDPFDPAADFTLEIWNCANGTMPTFIADRESLIVCGYDPANGYTLGDRVYAVDVPGGTCVDHGRSCYYRTRDVPSVTPGLRFFRVQYARAARGNRVWLD